MSATAAAPSKYYPAYDESKPKKRFFKPKPAKLRSSITPGTVVILVSGRFKGKRVVFLKQLKSGLLLITGPYKVNGVPLRRVNQAYVMATSTKVDISGLNLDKYNDEFFTKAVTEAKKNKDAFFAQTPAKPTIADERKAAQTEVDKVVLATVEKTPLLKQYLRARFGLSVGQYPHQLKF